MHRCSFLEHSTFHPITLSSSSVVTESVEGESERKKELTIHSTLFSNAPSSSTFPRVIKKCWNISSTSFQTDYNVLVSPLRLVYRITETVPRTTPLLSIPLVVYGSIVECIPLTLASLPPSLSRLPLPFRNTPGVSSFTTFYHHVHLITSVMFRCHPPLIIYACSPATSCFFPFPVYFTTVFRGATRICVIP